MNLNYDFWIEEVLEEIKTNYESQAKKIPTEWHSASNIQLSDSEVAQRYSDHYTKLITRRNQLMTDVRYLANGELQADISGFGLFISAGFPPEAFYQSRLDWRYSEKNEFADPASCLQALKQGHYPKFLNHYNALYPSPCYQLYILSVQEPRFYKMHAPELLNGSRTFVPTTYSLKQVHEEISAEKD